MTHDPHGPTAHRSAEGTRPNILFICADQLGAAQIGCYGSGVDSTPTLDRLAARGVRFDRFYARCPICAPNRATILTGRSPSIHGVTWNNFLLPNDMPTYAHVLRAAGYATGGFGKFHQTPMWLEATETVSHLGFEESVVAEDPKWESWIDWVRERAPEHYETALGMCWPGPRSRAGRSEKERHAYKEARVAAMRARESGRWKMAYASPLPAELHDTAYITELGLDYMERYSSAGKGGPGADGADRPFFCHVSYVDPHDPYDPPEPYASMFDPEEMPQPVQQAWSPQELPTLQSSTVWNDFETAHEDPQAMRELRARFHGSLRYMDDQIARLIEAAEKLDRPTIVIFATDHGEMLGDHGLITKAVKHYDAGIRCPLIVATINPDEPGGAGAQGGSGRVDRALRSSLDLFPTFCDFAGVGEEDRPPLEGRSFAAGGEGHAALCVEFESVATVITDDNWRLTRYADDGVTQLFDLSSDPAEQHDRSADPACVERKTAMLEELAGLLLRPHRVPQYRAMVPLGGRRIAPNPVKGGARGPAVTDYELTPPPDFEESE